MFMLTVVFECQEHMEAMQPILSSGRHVGVHSIPHGSNPMCLTKILPKPTSNHRAMWCCMILWAATPWVGTSRRASPPVPRQGLALTRSARGRRCQAAYQFEVPCTFEGGSYGRSMGRSDRRLDPWADQIRKHSTGISKNPNNRLGNSASLAYMLWGQCRVVSRLSPS